MIRALLVDDDRESLHVLRGILLREAWEVDVAPGTTEAMVMAAYAPPDLVVAGFSMVMAERYALLRRFRAAPRLGRTPILLVSNAEPDARDEELALELGASACCVLQAPDTAALFARMCQLVGECEAVSRDPIERIRSEREASEIDARGLLLESAMRATREREEQLRMALAAARMGTWDWDVHNDRFSWVTGHRDFASNAPGSFQGTLAECQVDVHPDDRDELAMLFQRALDERTEYAHEYRVVHSDGVVRWMAAWGRGIYGADDRPMRMVGVFMDVTERRRLEEQFRQSQKMEAIGQLAGGIAHDFNNVLAVIVGNTELARRDLGHGHPGLTSLAEIDRASQRARDLVKQILAFGRKQAAERWPISLQTVVEENASMLRATLPATVELSTVCAADTPLVLADVTQVHQVLLNLCTNAWHALAGRPGRIELRLSRVSSDAQSQDRASLLRGVLDQPSYARLSVSDSGYGMDEATRARMFEPFFTTKPKDHGTGLGLSVVDDIIKAHKGAIAVTTQPGHGSTFHLYFPASEQPISVAKTVVLARAPVAVPEGVPPAGRILYLDDEEPIVRVTTKMLEPLGYRVQGFTHASQALATFRADPSQFDLAITDLTMPGANGLEVAGSMMALRPDLPVILTSGFVTDDLMARALGAGIRQVMCKPVTMLEVCQALEAILSSIP
jgi:signal transduction histidine kinase/CheY-like chemotaxis protein